jgi:hypothetical protein
VRAAALAALALGSLVLAVASTGARAGADPGRLPQTTVLPSSATPRFRARMAALWRGIVRDDPAAAAPAFFPRSAYLQVKALPDASADYRDRLLHNFRLDVRAAHRLLGRGAPRARLVGVRVPREWAWIVPGYCANSVGYWHAPGSRLVYREGGHLRSFGIFSLISWRGEWYVVHLGIWNEPGTLVAPAAGAGAFGPPGGC